MHPDCREFMTEMLRVLKQERDAPRLSHFDMTVALDIDDCGFTACAIGTAAMDPWFRSRGLGFRYEDAHGRPLASRAAVGQAVLYAGHPVAFDGFDCVSDAQPTLIQDFVIPPRHFALLFGGNYFSSRQAGRTTTIDEVIEAIEHYIATGETPW